MKKIIALILAFIMCFFVNVFATTNVTANITLSPLEIGVGEYLNVTVAVSADKPFNAVSFDVIYDNEKLFFVSGENCNNTEDGKITCVVSGDNSQMSVTLCFAAVSSGEATITVEEVYVADGTNEYPANSTVKNVTISTVTKADLNGDGNINTTDLAIMKKIIASFDVSYIQSQADINGDLVINTTDLAILKKWVAGIY